MTTFDSSDKPWGWEEHRDGLNCLQEVIKSFNLPSLSGKSTNDQNNYEMTESGITSNLDITNILLQYFHWPEDERTRIRHCFLNMEKALKRCKAVYGVDEDGNNTCEIIPDKGTMFDKNIFVNDPKLKTPKEPESTTSDGSVIDGVPFVTRKCPGGLKRYGCCKCVRTCRSAGIGLRDENDQEYTNNDHDNALHCPKPRSYRSDHFKSFDKCEGSCEVYGDQFYVPKCLEGFQRYLFLFLYGKKGLEQICVWLNARMVGLIWEINV